MKRAEQFCQHLSLLFVGMGLILLGVIFGVRVGEASIARGEMLAADTDESSSYFVVNEAIPVATLQVNVTTASAASACQRNLTKFFGYFEFFQQSVLQQRCQHSQHTWLQRHARLVANGLLTIWQGRINC